jgi:hypothetical protein
VSALGTVVLGVIYAVVLGVALLSLPSQQQPIGDPLFSVLEILIILTVPLMVALMVAVHSWAPPEGKVFSVVALIFMSLAAGLTGSLHFVILTLGRRPEFAGLSWMPLFLSFRWPSVPYVLDILAWDVFFALSVLFAAAVFSGSRLTVSIRMLMIASGVLSLAGLSGVFVGNMQLRMIGVVGYAAVFPIAVLLLAILFYQSATREA